MDFTGFLLKEDARLLLKETKAEMEKLKQQPVVNLSEYYLLKELISVYKEIIEGKGKGKRKC